MTMPRRFGGGDMLFYTKKEKNLRIIARLSIGREFGIIESDKFVDFVEGEMSNARAARQSGERVRPGLRLPIERQIVCSPPQSACGGVPLLEPGALPGQSCSSARGNGPFPLLCKPSKKGLVP